MTSSENKYLFIGGSTKCGTTSLFNYFQFHPEVCACLMKESRFFWTNDYPLEASKRGNIKSDNYNDLFFNCTKNQIKLEATPDYLYSASTAKKLSELDGDKLFVFVLREPSDRFISWYKYASQNGLINSNMTINDYLQFQLNAEDSLLPQHFRSLQQGNYSNFLKTYHKLFGREKVLVVYYEDLKQDSKHLCNQISNFAGIGTGYFENYTFSIHNKSMAVQSVTAHKLFRKIRRGVRPLTKMFSLPVQKKLKFAARGFEKTYLKLNKKKNSSDVDSDINDVLDYLNEYYNQETVELTNLLGSTPPWKSSIKE